MISNSISSKINKRIYILEPNLGHPLFLSYKTENQGEKYQLDLLIATKIDNLLEIKDILDNELILVPILEYKWKLKRQYEEERKKRTIWKKIKDFFKREKKKKKELEEKLKKGANKPFRTDSISITLEDLSEKKESKLDDENYIKNEYKIPRSYLSKQNIFDNTYRYYHIRGLFNLSEELIDYLKQHNFVMFDIKNLDNSTNFHSLVISKQDWQNFTFMHITDTHLAERNDRIFSIVSNWLKSPIKQNIENFFGKVGSKLKSAFTSGSKKQDIKEYEVPFKSLKKRFINPNNQLRKFIQIANERVIQNKLDFLVLTGDIVDFVAMSKFSPEEISIEDLRYKKTNWKIFNDIILNRNSDQESKNIINHEELMCPIFTIVGNHDYRPYHYDLTWGGLYKKMGLKSSEAVALNELFSASPIESIIKSNKAINNYLVYINSSLDFHIKLGNIILIFLDSGADSFKNVSDFISGHPSVSGLEDSQIKYLENIINNFQPDKYEFILLIHGPPINVGEKEYFRNKFQKFGELKIRKKIGEFKESILNKLGKKDPSARIDLSYNVKKGTISNNWEKLINFCLNYTSLTLSGHTHELKEFRLEKPKKKSSLFSAPPFSLKKIENPAAVYFDIYSDLYHNSQVIEKHKPFVMQSPALGLGSYHKPGLVGGYRTISYKNGKLASFNVEFLE